MYCTVASVRARLPALTEAVIGDATVEEGIADAAAEIDGALGSRYTVPFSEPVPGLIASVAADLAAAWCLDTTFSGGGENDPTLLSQALRTRAQEKLEAVATGTYRGTDTLVSRGSLPGQVERVGARSNTFGQAPLLADGSWLYGPRSREWS